MQIALFRALKSANIDDDAAEKAVAVVEEHIEMAVARAVQPLDQKISSIEIKLEQGLKAIDGTLKGIQTSTDVLKWAVITEGTLIVIGGAIAGYVKLIG